MLRALAILLAAAPLLGAIDPSATPFPGAALPICHTQSKPDDDAPTAAQAILTGYGAGGFKIATSNPEAQAYFDNGMQLAYAFAHKAATGAFMRAEQLDPTCALCVWGEAWSRGPTINYDIKPKALVDDAALADKAAVLAKGGPASEQTLIAALQLRYHDGGGKGRGDLNFARAMDQIARAHPDAVKIDQANAIRLKTKDGVFGLGYHAHNVQFGMGAALLDGDAKGALFLAADEAARLPQVKAEDLTPRRCWEPPISTTAAMPT